MRSRIVTTKLGEVLILSENGDTCKLKVGKTIYNLPASYDDICAGIDKWAEGTLIQDALPFLSADDRELFLTGSYGTAYFGDDDDES
jgi:hypothetical protein